MLDQEAFPPFLRRIQEAAHTWENTIPKEY